MKLLYLINVLFYLFIINNVNAQDSIPDQNDIEIINNYHDLKIENQTLETWYIYYVYGGKWVKGDKGNKNSWVLAHSLTKIEINNNEVVKTRYGLSENKVEILPIEFADSLAKLNIEKLPTYFNHPFLKSGCTSQLPICLFLKIDDDSINNFDALRLEAEHYLKIYDFIRRNFWRN